MLRLFAIAAGVFGFMLVEARRAARNERQQRLRGGIEPRHDVYALMQVAYPGVFLAMLFEALFRPSPQAGWVIAGAVIVAAGKLLKWWAILALGDSWTFRVIVVPGMPLVRTGPYAFVRHPNYIGVVGELVGVAMMAGAPVAGVLGTLLFSGLMVLRVRIEARALDAILRRG